MSTQQRELHVDILSIADLIPDPRNVKMHSEIQIEQLMLSIQRFGFRDPIGIDDERNIVEGHGRLIAAQRLGMTEVPCLLLGPMSEDERRAYAVAHNQTQMNSELDLSVVVQEFDRLGVTDDDHLGLGFIADDLIFATMPDQEGAVNDQGQAQDWADHIPNVIKTNIKFDNEDQQRAFFRLLEVLRDRYPDCATIAERFARFMVEFGPEEVGSGS